ncbi:MAG: CHASE2 domain-containing protein [Alphaproteobacteria bacterium]|nr:CHASE2 domain-containing protein [Alphaproteobacteria bacterium]MBU1512594.1 CHASE2 domain-containing protein [Alphaproteobacteria bacterium]MBU2092933.1 CHASE2 domain-containing protein [Alphaproteobacteria bacterium]MBU2150828.1 CHASE2 domain-containing protein [Alphaproteobacteria bacterium]MBU2307960.1 CHASE2 domain-containing protein [Alphaproteobacteria bacterium]
MTDSRSPSDALSELDAGAKLRVRIAGLGAALAVALMVLFGGHLVRQPLYDLFQTLAPAPDVSRKVHVVVIDADSLRDVGGWPWTRFYLARLVEQISERGAAVIGFDILFPEPDRLAPSEFTSIYNELPAPMAQQIQGLPSMDAVFARVVGRNPVVLARAGVTQESFDLTDDPTPPLPPEAQFTGKVPTEMLAFPSVVANIPLLDGAPLGHGLVNGDRDSDGLVRRVPLFAKAAGYLTPSFAVELVRVAEGADQVELQSDGRRLAAVKVGGHRVPAGPDGQLLMRFGDWRKTQTTSAVDVLRQGQKPDQFKDQIVIIGLASAGTSDVTSTPRASSIYGVYVQAQAVDAILRGAALRRPVWAAPIEWGIGFSLVIISFLGVQRAPMALVLVGAAAEIVLAFGASWVAFSHNLLLDPFPMLAPGAANSAVMVALLFVEGRRVQARLRGALEDERLSAARISGELAAASEIQSGMLLPRAELDRVSPAVEIDALLQSAKTVGGDLYDAFLFDDGRVCFLVGDVTGKGVPASLFMALSKALSRSLLVRPNTSLQAAVREINAELSRDNRQAMAVSLLVGVLHPDTGQLDLCCAGHENPLIVDAQGVVRELKLDGGPPLCVDETFPYPEEIHRLEPGEVLVAFTDGLSEAQAPDGALFSRKQVFDALSQASKAPTLVGMMDSVVAQVRAFEAGGEPSDDLTVMALRLRRPA